MSDLDDLMAVSHYAGRDVLLAQGGGGNTSVKSADGRRMWIKASGLRLGQMRAGYGYLETDVAALLALLEDPDLAALPRQAAHEAAVARTQAATRDTNGLRPSLETTFHAVLARLVLHTHPVFVNAFTCLAGGRALLADTVKEAGAWVPYATPGYELGRSVAEAARGGEARTLVLENHGLIAAAETADEAMELTERLAAAGRRCFGELPGGALDTVDPPLRLEAWADGLRAALAGRYGLAPDTICARAATRRALLDAADEPEPWLLGGPLVPDDVVYGGHHAWAVKAARAPEAWLDEAPGAWAQTGRLIVAVRGLGVVLAGPSAAFVEAMEENLLAHVLVRRLIARRGEARPLAQEEVDYLLGMEAETYRQRVAAGGRI